jgi:hypothetical protein
VKDIGLPSAHTFDGVGECLALVFILSIKLAYLGTNWAVLWDRVGDSERYGKWSLILINNADLTKTKELR